MDIGYLTLGDHLPDPTTGVRMSAGEKVRGAIETAINAEDLGYDVVGIGEHHFNDYIFSSPFTMLSAVASRTARIKLTTSLTVLPLHDPVLVAEDFTTLDQISDGRAEMILGRGLGDKGYAEFGIDYATSRDLMVDKLDLLRRLWTEESVSFDGTFRPPLQNIGLRPAPAKAEPLLWMGSGMTEDSIRWTAGLGLPLMLPTIMQRPEGWSDLVDLYRELMAAAGNADKALVGACSYVHVAPTTQAAREKWRPHLMQYIEWVGSLFGRTDTRPWEELVSGPAIGGSPAEVSESLLSIKNTLNIDRHLAVFDVGGMSHHDVNATMELYAAEVMPKLR